MKHVRRITDTRPAKSADQLHREWRSYRFFATSIELSMIALIICLLSLIPFAKGLDLQFGLVGLVTIFTLMGTFLHEMNKSELRLLKARWLDRRLNISE